MEFVNEELKKLDKVKGNFNNNEKEQYKEEVDYINSLLEILKKRHKNKPIPQPSTDIIPRQEPITPENKPTNNPTPKNEPKKKKETKKALHSFVNNFSLKKATDINLTELPDDVMLDAKLTKMSSKYYKTGGIDADNFMEQEGIKDWKIDTDLSSDKGLVVVNENTGKVKVAYRGTDAKGMNIQDLETDAKIYMGTENDTAHFKEAREQMRNVIEKYGKPSVENISGYSLGGNKSWAMGNEFKIPSRGFNSFIGKSIVNKADNYDPDTKHEIYRTQDDLASIQSQYISGKNNTEIFTIGTLGSEYAGLNPYTAHSINNFISNEGRNSNNKSYIDGRIQEVVNHAVQHGELRTLHDMVKQNKKYNVKNLGDINETEYMNRLNIIDNTLNERSRINKLTQNDRSIARKSRVIQPDFEERGNDFNSGITPDKPISRKSKVSSNFDFTDEPEPDTLINRNNPMYQNNLEQKAKTLSKPFLPKKKLPKTVAQEINNSDDAERFLEAYNQDGTPKEETSSTKRINIRKQINSLESGREYLNNRSSKGNYRFSPEVDTLGNETRALEQRLGLNNRTITPNDKNMLMRKKKITNYESKNKKSKALLEQTKSLEERLNINDIDIQPAEIQPESQSFTEWTKNNNIESTDHTKTLWKKSGGTLTTEEKNNFNESNTHNNENTLNNFIENDLNERNTVLDDISQTQNKLETNLTDTMEAPVRTGGNYGMDIARGLHPQNLILGYFSDLGAKNIMENYVDKALPNQGEFLQTAERGGIAGAISAGVLGASVLPEIGAGATGYVAQKYTQRAVYSGLKDLGVGEDYAGAASSTAGGVAGGATAGAVGSFLAGVVAGGEDGAVVGGGVFSAEASVIGGVIGGIIGLGAYAKGRAFGK